MTSIVVMFLLNFCIIFIFYAKTMNFIKKLNAHNIEREKELKEWLFKSLYSIDNKVLLPGNYEKKLSARGAKVYNPEKDPMREFYTLKF